MPPCFTVECNKGACSLGILTELELSARFTADKGIPQNLSVHHISVYNWFYRQEFSVLRKVLSYVSLPRFGEDAFPPGTIKPDEVVVE